MIPSKNPPRLQEIGVRPGYDGVIAKPSIDPSGKNANSMGRHLALLRDRLCADFEAGLHIDWQELLREVGADERAGVLRELLPVEIQLRRQGGESPALEDYAELLPEFQEAVQDCLQSAEHREETDAGRNQALEPTEMYVDDQAAAAAPGMTSVWPFSPAEGPGELGRFGPYRMLKLLGEGGMGHVFLAEDTYLKRRVAIKLMRKELAVVPDFKERFLREARAMAALEHPYIVPVYQIGEEAETPFLCMPFLLGETLASRLRRTKRLSRVNALKLASQLAEGLSAAHRAGMIHRDIKPSNIWLTPPNMDAAFQAATPEDGFRDIRILDFGLVRLDKGGETITGSHDLLGTLGYMSPEQAARQRVTARSDLFSLGVVLYETCTGMAPFLRTNPILTIQALANAKPRAPRFFNPEMGIKLSDLVMWLLAKSPDDRPKSAEAVLKEVNGLLQKSEQQNAVKPEKPPVKNEPDEEEEEEDKDDSPGFSFSLDVDQLRMLLTVVVLSGVLVAGILFPYLIVRQKTQVPTRTQQARQDARLVPSAAEQNAAVQLPVSPVPETPLVETPPPVEAVRPEIPSEGTATESAGVDRVVVVAIPETEADQPVDAGERATLLPGRLHGAVLVNQGRQLLLSVHSSEDDPASEDGIVIYDVPTGRLTHLLRLSTSEFQFSAGGQVLLIYFNEFQRLQAWNLETWEKLADRDFQNDGRILRMVMGPDRSDPALLRIVKDKQPEALSSTYLIEMNPARLEIAPNASLEKTRGHNTSFRDFVHYRANRDLSLVTEWCTSHSPEGVGVLVRDARGEYKHLYNHDTESYLAAGIDDVIYTGRGSMLSVDPSKRDSYGNANGELKAIGSIKDTLLVPALDAAVFVGVGPNGEMTLYPSGKTTPVLSLGTFPDADAGANSPLAIRAATGMTSTFGFDQRLRLIVGERALLCLPLSNDRVVRRPFDWSAFQEPGGFLVILSVPPKVARWKDDWTYPIQVVSHEPGVTYELLSGPDGMAVDSSGVVRWKVPSGIEGRVTIKIKISNPSGRELIHRFVVMLVDAGA